MGPLFVSPPAFGPPFCRNPRRLGPLGQVLVDAGHGEGAEVYIWPFSLLMAQISYKRHPLYRTCDVLVVLPLSSAASVLTLLRRQVYQHGVPSYEY